MSKINNWENVVLALKGSGQLEEAVQIIAKVLEKAEDAPIPHYWMADVRYDMKQYEEVVHHCDRIIALNKSRTYVVAAHTLRGNALKRCDRLPEAKLAWKAAYESADPPDWVVVYNYACALALDGETEEAIAQVSALLRMRPDKANQVAVDSDFDSLKSEPAYLQLLALPALEEDPQKVTALLRSDFATIRERGLEFCMRLIQEEGVIKEEWIAIVPALSKTKLSKDALENLASFVMEIAESGNQWYRKHMANVLVQTIKAIRTPDELIAHSVQLAQLQAAIQDNLRSFHREFELALIELLDRIAEFESRGFEDDRFAPGIEAIWDIRKVLDPDTGKLKDHSFYGSLLHVAEKHAFSPSLAGADCERLVQFAGKPGVERVCRRILILTPFLGPMDEGVRSGMPAFLQFKLLFRVLLYAKAFQKHILSQFETLSFTGQEAGLMMACLVDPESEEVLDLIGNPIALFVAGKMESLAPASADYKKWLAMKERLAFPSLVDRAKQCHKRGDFQGAAIAYAEADRLQPNHAWLAWNLCSLYSQLQQYKLCIAHADKAIALGERGDRAAMLYGMRGNALKELGRIPEAAESWKLALEVHPLPDFAQFYNHACGLALLGRFPDALQYLEIALEIRPESVPEALSDPDFEPIRGTTEFQAIFKRIEDGDSQARTTRRLRSVSKILRIWGAQAAGSSVTAYGCPPSEWPALIVKICHEDLIEGTESVFVNYVEAVEAACETQHLEAIAKALVAYWDSVQSKSDLEAIGQGLDRIGMDLRSLLVHFHDLFADAIIRLLERANSFEPAPLEDLGMDTPVDRLSQMYCGLTLKHSKKLDPRFAEAIVTLMLRYNFSLTTEDNGQRIARAASQACLSRLLLRFDELIALTEPYGFHDDAFPAWPQIHCILSLLTAQPWWLPAIQEHWARHQLPLNAASVVMHRLLEEADYDSDNFPEVLANPVQAYLLSKVKELDQKPAQLIEWEELQADAENQDHGA